MCLGSGTPDMVLILQQTQYPADETLQAAKKSPGILHNTELKTNLMWLSNIHLAQFSTQEFPIESSRQVQLHLG